MKSIKDINETYTAGVNGVTKIYKLRRFHDDAGYPYRVDFEDGDYTICAVLPEGYEKEYEIVHVIDDEGEINKLTCRCGRDRFQVFFERYSMGVLLVLVAYCDCGIKYEINERRERIIR